MLREGRWSHQPSGLSCSGQAVAEAVWRAGIRVPELWAGGAEPKHGHHCVPFKDPFLVTLEKRGCSKYKELFL